MAESGLYQQPPEKWNLKKRRSWKDFAFFCYGFYMGRTTRNHRESVCSPIFNIAVKKNCCVQLQALAERQAKQIEDGNAFANQAAAQSQESQRQLEISQQNLSDLTAAFNSLSTQGRPLTVTSAPKKKPDLPAKTCSFGFVEWKQRI